MVGTGSFLLIMDMNLQQPNLPTTMCHFCSPPTFFQHPPHLPTYSRRKKKEKKEKEQHENRLFPQPFVTCLPPHAFPQFIIFSMAFPSLVWKGFSLCLLGREEEDIHFCKFPMLYGRRPGTEAGLGGTVLERPTCPRCLFFPYHLACTPTTCPLQTSPVFTHAFPLSLFAGLQLNIATIPSVITCVQGEGGRHAVPMHGWADRQTCWEEDLCAACLPFPQPLPALPAFPSLCRPTFLFFPFSPSDT